MNEIISVNSEITMTSLEIAELTGKEHNKILRDIRDEIRKLGDKRGQLIFQPTEYVDKFNRKQPMYNLTKEGVLQLEARFKLIEKQEAKQEERAETIKNKLRNKGNIERCDYEFCKINRRLFENIRFKKIRKADKKWQTQKS